MHRFAGRDGRSMKTAERIDDAEMLEILTDIARNSGNASARIAAIRVLRELDLGRRAPVEGFEALDEAKPGLKAVL